MGVARKMKAIEGMDTDFQETMKKMETVFDGLDNMTKENERTLLYKCAQDIEFIDSTDGFTKEEFDMFRGRIPRRRLKTFDGMAQFDKLVDSSGTIPSDK